MKIKNKNIKILLEKYKKISILGNINATLGWDLNVNLPAKASEGRAEQSAYVTKLIAEKWLEPEFKGLVEDVGGSHFAKAARDEAAIIRNIKRASKYYWNVPKEIIVEFSETTSKAFMVWQFAKRDNKFKDFLPHLKKVIKLNQIIAGHLGYEKNPYDALLDLYEPSLTAKECELMFNSIQPVLTKLLNKVTSSKNYVSDSELLNGSVRYPQSDQKQLAQFALRKMNYDLEAGRMDVSSHPFEEKLGKNDVRITGRFNETDFRDSFTAAMHETGHALYEQGVNEDYSGTPLDGGVSLGIHESQSRLWENIIGRSKEFIQYMMPVFLTVYPEQLAKAGGDDIFRLFNLVKPSLIRVEADEVTYNLHIALRFEIENGLINNKLKAEDLPEIWREKMKKYLGIKPKDDREGVLQDVHWSHGSFGYFPTYTLGNLYAAQFTKAMRKEIEMEKCIEKGDLGTILSWLRTNIHQYGSLYWPKELCKKVTGEELNPKYFLEYLKEKYSDIYELKSL